MKTIKFNKQFDEVIKSGLKTQTRRPMKSHTPKYNINDYVLVDGADYAISIINVRSDKLQTMSPKDVSEELGVEVNKTSVGVDEFCSMLINFKDIWAKFYRDTEHRLENDPTVWVYDFRVVERK